jgi:hypothetical protein
VTDVDGCGGGGGGGGGGGDDGYDNDDINATKQVSV